MAAQVEKLLTTNSIQAHRNHIPQVALKRQQAVEDAIALRLASNETGKLMESLPQGKIFGMNVTEPKAEKDLKANAVEASSDETNKAANESSQKSLTTPSSTMKPPNISQNAIEMLSSLFPHRKRSVLELVLRRCDSDLLRLVQALPLSSLFFVGSRE